MPLELQNGKLYPFRNANGVSYREYLNLHGLAAVLNSKYREHTFDFLGDGLISNLLRDSIARGAWDPPEHLKGSLQLPILVGR